MAVDIFNPPPGSPLGPGIPYLVRQLPPVPIIPQGQWEVSVMDTALPDNIIVRQIHRFEGTIPTQPGGVIGDAGTEHTYLPGSRTLTVQGSEVTLRARLLDQNGSHVVEQTSILGVWDSSFAWMLPTSAVSGGFTQADRDDLVLVKGSVATTVPGSIAGASQLVRLIDFAPAAVPRSLLRPFGSLLIEGRGTIPVQPGGALFTFGGVWTWFRIPPEWSVDRGVLDRYGNRVLQLEVIREGLDDSLYIDQVVEENSQGGHILWAFPNPTQVAFDLRPGWQATWQWLVFP